MPQSWLFYLVPQYYRPVFPLNRVGLGLGLSDLYPSQKFVQSALVAGLSGWLIGIFAGRKKLLCSCFLLGYTIYFSVVQFNKIYNPDRYKQLQEKLQGYKASDLLIFNDLKSMKKQYYFYRSKIKDRIAFLDGQKIAQLKARHEKKARIKESEESKVLLGRLSAQQEKIVENLLRIRRRTAKQ